MNFNSQICTTKEQSERLLALGLKKETADMCINLSHESELVYSFSYSEALSLYHNYGLDRITNTDSLLPAWSLHRLIEMMPSTLQNLYELDFSKRGVYYADFSNGSFNFIQSFAKPTTILYDNIINCIEWLIKEGYFNKEYLKE